MTMRQTDDVYELIEKVIAIIPVDFSLISSIAKYDIRSEGEKKEIVSRLKEKRKKQLREELAALEGEE